MKSSSPSSDRFGAHPKALADLCVAMALRSQQYELGSQHLTVWPRITRGLMLKLLALGLFEDDLLGSDSRHRRQDSPAATEPLQSGRDFRLAALSAAEAERCSGSRGLRSTTTPSVASSRTSASASTSSSSARTSKACSPSAGSASDPGADDPRVRARRPGLTHPRQKNAAEIFAASASCG